MITGVGRKIGVGSAIALKLAESGWDVALTFFRAYDASQPWGSADTDLDILQKEIEAIGLRFFVIEAA